MISNALIKVSGARVLATSFIMDLLLYPVLFFLAKSVAMRRAWRRDLIA